jgi:hypothetical protein
MDKEKSQVLLLDFLDDYFIFQRYFFTLTFESTYATLDQAEEAKNQGTIITEHMTNISCYYLQKSTICDIIYSV